MLHISLAAEPLWHIGGLTISNAFLTTYVVMAILAIFSFFATRNLKMIPTSGLQVIAESIVGGLYDFFESIAGRHIKQFFPIVASLFIFILIANWVGLLPGVGTVGFYRTEEAAPAAESMEQAESVPAELNMANETAPEQAHGTVAETTPSVAHEETGEATMAAATHKESETAHEGPEFVPLLRAATADLNMTLALAIVSVLAMQYFGFKNLGMHYSGRFLNFKDPIMFGVGLLELASDISKVVSFAFRLFGNIFAGEVLLAVIAFLMPFIVPLPFLFMELFVGLVQALVFSMLSVAFFNVAVSHGEEEHAEAHA